MYSDFTKIFIIWPLAFASIYLIFTLQILKVLSENAVAVRTKAMKCLTAVIEADPGVLARVSTREFN